MTGDDVGERRDRVNKTEFRDRRPNHSSFASNVLPRPLASLFASLPLGTSRLTPPFRLLSASLSPSPSGVTHGQHL